MRIYDLDGERVAGGTALHAYLREALELPDYYGNNLDALFDCLTELGEPTVLRLTRAGALEDLGSYGRALLDTLRDAEEENPNLRLVYQEPMR